MMNSPSTGPQGEFSQGRIYRGEEGDASHAPNGHMQKMCPPNALKCLRDALHMPQKWHNIMFLWPYFRNYHDAMPQTPLWGLRTPLDPKFYSSMSEASDLECPFWNSHPLPYKNPRCAPVSCRNEVKKQMYCLLLCCK